MVAAAHVIWLEPFETSRPQQQVAISVPFSL